jgi:hypothetical protein
VRLLVAVAYQLLVFLMKEFQDLVFVLVGTSFQDSEYGLLACLVEAYLGLGICRLAWYLLAPVFAQEDTFSLDLDTCRQASGPLVWMVTAFALVGISLAGLDTYLQASGHVVLKEMASVPEVMMVPLEDRQQMAYHLPLLEPCRKLL